MKEIQRDLDDGIDTTGKKMTVCQLYAKQNSHRKNVKRSTEKGREYSQRRPLHVLFFVPGLRPQARFGAQLSEARHLARRSARFFFSREKKRNVGRKRSPLCQEGKTPPGRAEYHVYFFPKEVFTRSLAA